MCMVHCPVVPSFEFQVSSFNSKFQASVTSFKLQLQVSSFSSKFQASVPSFKLQFQVSSSTSEHGKRREIATYIHVVETPIM